MIEVPTLLPRSESHDHVILWAVAIAECVVKPSSYGGESHGYALRRALRSLVIDDVVPTGVGGEEGLDDGGDGQGEEGADEPAH